MGLFKNMDVNLAEQVYRAAVLCGQSNEEEGGIILKKDADFLFHKIKNIYTGSNTAIGLYEADEFEFKNLIVPEIAKGWKMYGSFHTHPSFSATPSSLDMSKLFLGFKHNFIYATERNIFSSSVWVAEDAFSIIYIPMSTMKTLINYYVI